MTLRPLKTRLQRQRALADDHTRDSLQGHERGYKKILWAETTIEPDHMVLVDQSPLFTSVTTSATALSNAT